MGAGEITLATSKLSPRTIEKLVERLEVTPETVRAWHTFRLIDGGISGRPRPMSIETRGAAMFNHHLAYAHHVLTGKGHPSLADALAGAKFLTEERMRCRRRQREKAGRIAWA